MAALEKTIWLVTAAATAFWSLVCAAGYGLVALFGGIVQEHVQGLHLHPAIDPWIAAAFGVTQDLGPVLLVTLWVGGVVLILGLAALTAGMKRGVLRSDRRRRFR
ncbi:MAG: hypothetical protein AB7M05_16685 [Alphaproteobacteria bacterium]